MKNLLIKGVSGFALTFVAQAALAAPVTITDTATTGPKILATSRAVLTPSAAIRGTINAYRNGTALPVITSDLWGTATLGYVTHPVTKVNTIGILSFSGPVKSMTYEASNRAILSHQLQGSIKIVTPVNAGGFFAKGGEMAIQDMRVNHTTKTIHATVIGGNGYGTRTDVPVWTYGAVSGNATFPGDNIQTGLAPLRLTAEGVAAWAQSLGLTSTGQSSLNGINASTEGFGTMAITVDIIPPVDETNCVGP
jgi:hypothetical protein